MPQISIIVPCYNQSEYLDDSLGSVLAQDYDDWECIVVNDGSKDETKERAQAWCAKDSRFRYLEKENGGLSSARNAGIAEAKGAYILPLDADDRIGDQYLSLAMAVFKKNKRTKLVYCKAEMFGHKNEFWKLSDFKFKKLLRKNLIFCSCIYRKIAADKIGGYDEEMKLGYEDWEFLIRFCSQIRGRVHRLDYLGFFYRTKEVSMVRDLDMDLRTKKLVIRHIQNKHRKLYKRNKLQIWWNKRIHKIKLIP